MSDQHSREISVFLEAIEKDGAEELRSYLAEACGDNEALRADVEALLVAHRKDNKTHDAAIYSEDQQGNPRSDWSNVRANCWELYFLRSAHNAGFEVPQAWVDEGVEFIEGCYRPGPLVAFQLL